MTADEISQTQDLLIELLKQEVDREALRANLKLTVEQRLDKLTERLQTAEAEGRRLDGEALRNLEAIAELEVLLEETQKQSPDSQKPSR